MPDTCVEDTAIPDPAFPTAYNVDVTLTCVTTLSPPSNTRAANKSFPTPIPPATAKSPVVVEVEFTLAFNLKEPNLALP